MGSDALIDEITVVSAQVIIDPSEKLDAESPSKSLMLVYDTEKTLDVLGSIVVCIAGCGRRIAAALSE